jgi:hypothetical protein
VEAALIPGEQVILEVLTATSKITDVASCSHVENDQGFIGAYASIVRAMIILMIEAVSTIETSINFYDTTQRNIPEDMIFTNVAYFFESWVFTYKYKPRYQH